MRTSRFDTNLINLRSSIEHNIESWGVLASAACNHIYSKSPKEQEESGQRILMPPKASAEEPEFVDPEEYEAI